MIHLYNIGYTGRYVAFPDCEFQEGVTRTFDEEAGRHRKFSLGAHELMFNPFQDIMGHGVFTQLFRNFLTCDIPSYYKIFLTAYLQSYTSGGIYIIVFTIAAIARLIDFNDIESLWAFSPAAVIILNIIVYYVVGYTTFLIALCRMHKYNKKLFFPEYREHGKLYLVYRQLRHTMWFQIQFYTVMGNYFFLGGMDHLISRPNICGATNKDALTVSRCTALKEVIRFNCGSWLIATVLAIIALATVWQEYDWRLDFYDDIGNNPPSFGTLLFVIPTLVMSVLAIVVPIVMNPYVLGCYKRNATEVTQDHLSVLGNLEAATVMTRPPSARKAPRTKERPLTKGNSTPRHNPTRPLLIQGVSI